MKRLDNYVNMLMGGLITDFKIGQNVTESGNSSYIIGFISNKTGAKYNNAALLKGDKKTFHGIYSQQLIVQGDKDPLTQAEIEAGRKELKIFMQKPLFKDSFLQEPGVLNTSGNDEIAETPEAKAARVARIEAEKARVAADAEAAPAPSLAPAPTVPSLAPALAPIGSSAPALASASASATAATAAQPQPPAPPAPPGSYGSYGSYVSQNRKNDEDVVVLPVNSNPAAPVPSGSPVKSNPAAPVPSGSPVVAASSFYDSGPAEPTYFRVTVYKTINGKDTYVNSGPAYPQDTIKKILDAFKVSGNICIVSSGKQFVKSLNGKDLYTTLGMLHLKYESVELFVL